MASSQVSTEIALLQLRAFCETCRSFYGPQRSWKAVVDPKTQEANLSADPIEVLSVACACTRVGNLLLRSASDHRRQCGCGTASFLALARELAAHLGSLCHTYQLAPHQIARANHRAAAETATIIKGLVQPCINALDSTQTLRALRRGSPEDQVFDAAVLVARKLDAHRHDQWDMGAVLLHRVKTGYARSVRVFPGLILPTSLKVLRAWKHARGPVSTLRVALLKNSFSLRATELGSHQASQLDPLKILHSGARDGSADLASRRTSILAALQDAGIRLLVCTGGADEALCIEAAPHLLVLAHTHIREIESLERMFTAHIFSDLEQLLMWAPSAPVTSARLEGLDSRSWGDRQGAEAFLHIVPENDASPEKMSGEIVPASILFASPIEALLQDMESRFWASLYRLRNVVQSSSVLPGAGKTDRNVSLGLRALAQTTQDSMVALVLHAWADAFGDLAANVDAFADLMPEQAQDSQDDPVSKLAAVDAAARLLHRIIC